MTKGALDPRMWAVACVHWLKHAYAGTLLRMQLGFQKYKKDKFFAILIEVWNESHIV